MTDPKWTPGKWWINEDDRPGMSWNREIVYGDGENRICFLAHSDGATREHDEANAHLIAAAPELYAGLVEALDFVEGMLVGAAILRGEIGTIKIEPPAEMIRLRSVLAKARGE